MSTTSGDKPGPGAADGTTRAGGATASATQEFRVLSHEGKKFAFKLEHIFWRILSFAAASQKQRLGTYVAGVLDNEDAGANRTSLLRVHAADWLSNRLMDTAAQAVNPRVITRIVQSYPTPCLVIDSTDRITSHNEPFLALLANSVDPHQGAVMERVRVSFGREIAAVRHGLRLSRTGFVDELVQVETPLGLIHRNARVMMIDSMRGQPIGMLVLLQAH